MAQQLKKMPKLPFRAFKSPLIRFLISNCACLGHLERSAAESRDLVTVHGLVSYTRFLRLKATSWPSGRNDKSAQFNRIW